MVAMDSIRAVLTDGMGREAFPIDFDGDHGVPEK